MKAGKVVGDSVVDPGQLTSLLLHFADETVTQVALEFLGEYKQTNISEYQFANGLLYTPYQLGGAWNDLPQKSLLLTKHWTIMLQKQRQVWLYSQQKIV